MIHVPAKYNRLGIRVKCTKCDYQVSTICKGTGKGIGTCKYRETHHKFLLIVVVPGGKGKRRMKLLTGTKDIDEVLIQLKKFREELQGNGYRKVVRAERPQAKTLMDFFSQYLDVLSGKNTPEHLIRRRSENHVADSRRGFEALYAALCKQGYLKNTLLPSEVCEDEVGIFHAYLLKDLGLAPRTYNKYITVLRSFYKWLIETKHLPLENHFRSVELQSIEKGENMIITQEEFESLLKVITRENGVYRRNNRVVKNVYRPYLRDVIRLALETGLRREELFTIRWSDLYEVDPGKYIFRLSNLKVNRIMRTSSSLKFVPLTQSLSQLLDELGMAKKMGTDDYLIKRPKDAEMNNLKDAISRGFTHYIKLVTDRPITFKVLRKTYITHLAMVLGERTGLYTGHSNDEVLRNHYLSSAFVAGNLGEFRIF